MELCSYYIPLSFCEYISTITKEYNNQHLLEKIPSQFHNKLAQILDQLEHKELALDITNDPNHKLELSLQLENLQYAYELSLTLKKEAVFKQVGDFALKDGDLVKAIDCFEKCNDYSNLLLIYSSLGMREQLNQIAIKSETEGKYNVSFQSYFQLQNLEKCVEVLIKSNKYCEAAFFSKTYCPSLIPKVITPWIQFLKEQGYELVANKITSPLEFLDTDKYKDLKHCLEIESFLKKVSLDDIPADQYLEIKEILKQDLFKISKENNFQKDLSQVIQYIGQTKNPKIQNEEKEIPKIQTKQQKELQIKSQKQNEEKTQQEKEQDLQNDNNEGQKNEPEDDL